MPSSKSLAFLLTALLLTGAAYAKGPQISDPKKVDDDFQFQGEYEGEIKSDEGDIKFGVQVIALGKGKFKAVSYMGGLPGAGWQGNETLSHEGERDGDKVVFKAEHAVGVIHKGVLKVEATEGNARGELKKVIRKSPTLGAKPPKGAKVLFDGKSADLWENGKIENGLLQQGVTSKPKFQSHTLHIEFRLPYQPEDRGQGRGNSGLYLQGRYEVQMLDSFGLEGKNNECGGIYEIRDPDLNMCFPPLSWQTYDIEFTAAKYDDDGKVVANPRMTVKHNGVIVHKDVELPRSTRASRVKPGPGPGPIYLQNHGNPVRYRNIWVVEK